MNLLNWLTTAQVRYPPIFDQLKRPNGTFNGKDLSMYFTRTNQRTIGRGTQAGVVYRLANGELVYVQNAPSAGKP